MINVLRSKNLSLLVINSLSKHGDPRLRLIYDFIERAGVKTARRMLGPHYGRIEAMRNEEATVDRFIEMLYEMSVDPDTGALDLFLQLHGEKGMVCFFDRWISIAGLGRLIRRRVKKDNLRLLYNTCCYGDSHSTDFLRAGFKVAIGSIGVNASAAVEYPQFCRLWPGRKGGRRVLTVDEIVRKADRPLPRHIQDRFAVRYFKDVDSRKIVRGAGKITILDDPALFPAQLKIIR